MAALGIRGKDANAAAVPLAHGGAADRAAESPPPGNGIDHCLSRKKARNAKLEAKLVAREQEHARLEAKIAAREQEQAQVITSLTLQNEWLLEQLKLSKKKLFGRSSEQVEQMVMEQLSFTYNEAEAYASGTKAATEKPVAVKAHERKR